jgi:hypothetical protein
MVTHKVYLEDLPKNTKTPFSTYCRKLIKENYPFYDKLEMHRKSDDLLLLSTQSIGEAAKWTILETDKVGPTSVPYKAFKIARKTPTCTP